MTENDEMSPKKVSKSANSNNLIFSSVPDTKKSETAHVVNDLMMMAEEDPLSMIQAKAYHRELQFAKTFSLLLSEDGINPKDFDEELEIEYGCKLDDVFKVSTSGTGSIKFIIPSNLAEARAMLQAKYQAILKVPLVATGAIQDDSKAGTDSPDMPLSSSTNVPKTALSDALLSDGQQQKKKATSVKRTYGRITQSTGASDDTASPPSKRADKTAPPASGTSSTEPFTFSSIAEIEAYFYASIKGSQSYTEAKGEYRFECCVCNEVFDENIKAVMHMHSHVGDATGTVASRCPTCYRWFPNEVEMEKHREEHSSDKTGNICRICDCESFHDLADLASHMQTTHVRREMPYACRLCGFRSSLYMDAIDHFTTSHAGSSYAQCAFCLQVYQLKPSATGGPCRTANFFDHISRHQREKETQANCYRCRLSFLGFGDLPRHEKLEHQPGNSLHCVSRFPALIAVASGAQSTAKSGASAASKQQDVDLSRVTINLPATSSTNGPALCRECGQPMAKKGHFGRYTSCTSAPGQCTFASACTFAMTNHVARHRRQVQTRSSSAVTAPPLSKPLYCSCGFSTSIGAAMAAHLLSCPSGSSSCSTVPLPGAANGTSPV